MALIRVIYKGMELFGYECPACGRKELHDKQDDPECLNCGAKMRNINIQAALRKNKEKETPSDGGVDAVPESADSSAAADSSCKDSCGNCLRGRKSPFVFNGVERPGYKCSKDGRTHSPDSVCKDHKRRGRRPKSK